MHAFCIHFQEVSGQCETCNLCVARDWCPGLVCRCNLTWLRHGILMSCMPKCTWCAWWQGAAWYSQLHAAACSTKCAQDQHMQEMNLLRQQGHTQPKLVPLMLHWPYVGICALVMDTVAQTIVLAGLSPVRVTWVTLVSWVMYCWINACATDSTAGSTFLRSWSISICGAWGFICTAKEQWQHAKLHCVTLVLWRKGGKTVSLSTSNDKTRQ